jgi:hypothetical protein
MKRYLKMLATVWTVALLLASCGQKEDAVTEVTSITITPSTLAVTVGEKQTLTATVEPQNATDKTVTWSSSDQAIAGIDASSGEVTAIAVGTATVTATAAGDRTASCEITVWGAVGELIQEGEILIIAYSFAPYSEVKAAGLDMCWTWTQNISTVMEELNEARDNGIRLLVVLQRNNTEAMVNAIKGHPALGGYMLADEPPIQDFDYFDQWIREIQAYDAEHYCYINLFPNYATPQQLGTSSYLEYLRTFAKLPTGFISFDHYPTNGRGGYVNLGWYANLEDVRMVANEHNISFWTYVLSTRDYIRGEAFTLGELSLMVYTNLAYGSQANQYFYFNNIGNPSDYAPITVGKRTPTFDLVTKLSTDVKRLSHIFSKSKVLGVWHTGTTLPVGTTRLQEENPPEMPLIKSLKTNDTGALVSLIEKDNNRYLVIVNHSYIFPMTLTLTVEGNAVKRVLKDGTIASMTSGTVNVDMGDVAIYMWKK